jgi:cytochrome b561
MTRQTNPLATARYPTAAAILHWIVAVGTLTLVATGAFMVGLPRNTEQRALLFNLHKSLGILTAAFSVALIAWRLRNRPPALPAAMAQWEQRAAALNHVLFYLLMVIVAGTGYLTSSFSKFGPKLFGIPIPHWGWDDPVLRGHFADSHRVAAWTFAALIGLHVIAALKHLLLDRDGVFQRMVPAARSDPPAVERGSRRSGP